MGTLILLLHRSVRSRVIAFAVLAALLLPGAAALAADAAVDSAGLAGNAPLATAHHASLGERLPLWSALPFAGILLSIALFPLLAPHIWHHHFPKISAAWALLLAIPFLAVYRDEALQKIIHIAVIDYIPFIILLWALFTIAGGIYVGGALRGSPGLNTLMLLIGTLLASWIGTTGAAMVMIRPLLRANAWRTSQVHVVAFFIFLVANIGGSLTPLGDPPLFLGFLHGVPFFWVTTAVLRETATAMIILLAIFYLVDRRAFRQETARPPEAAPGEGRVRIAGLHNLLFLLGVMAGVLFSGAADLGLQPVYGHVVVERQNLARDLFLLLMGWLSLRTTSSAVRRRNDFSWGPIREVAILFAGIFVTIIPALEILQAGTHGAMAGLIRAVREPAHYFWASGALSSFLDNAPTYLTFFNTALGSLGVPESAVPGMLGHVAGVAANPGFVRDLTAISAGAVFMGANTYIGNAPNFMVKSIAEEAGVPMPSFFGYMFRYSIPFLIPTFIVITLLFFR
ncbi:MAG: sodium:proton antiporter [Candidatus Krumholzibacteriia bacterium]